MRRSNAAVHAGARRDRIPEAATGRPVSWSAIERAILLRIARKEYVPGQQIPTCEALATELGANKNTVSKAYRSLAQRGYLMTRAGFGTFVSRRPVRISLDSALQAIMSDPATGVYTVASESRKDGQAEGY
jgi:DNA-binding transcriptional regulator YhcF (GntR family)